MKHLDMFKTRGVALVASAAAVLGLVAGGRGGAVAGSLHHVRRHQGHAIEKGRLLHKLGGHQEGKERQCREAQGPEQSCQ